MTEKYYGNHLGLVINDNDPENRGRVQVFIPHISTTLFQGWNEVYSQDNEKIKDPIIKGMGEEQGGLPDVILERLKRILPWAEGAMPIWGGGTSAVYNPASKVVNTDPQSALASNTRNTEPLNNQSKNSPQENLLRFVISIGYEETGFSSKEAYSEVYNSATGNSKTNNDNVASAMRGIDPRNNKRINPMTLAEARSLFGDYGYYQTNGADVQRAIDYGMDPQLAQALNGGGSGGKYDIHMQTKAVYEYILKSGQNGPYKEFLNNILAGRFEAAANSKSIWKGSVARGVGLSGKLNTSDGEVFRQIWSGNYPPSIRVKLGQSLDVNVVSSPSTLGGSSQAVSVADIGQTTSTGQVSAPLPKLGTETTLSELPPLSGVQTSSEDPKLVRNINPSAGSMLSAPMFSGGTGMVSVPKPGAKVWVFFHGGDAQQPVYFAQQPDPVSYQNIQEINSPSNLNEDTDTQIAQNNTIDSKQGGLRMVMQLVKQKFSKIASDWGHTSMYDKNGNRISFTSDGQYHNNPGNETRKIGGNSYTTVRGNSENFVNGTSNTVNMGDHYSFIGEQGTPEIEATNQLQGRLNKIHQDKIDYISKHAVHGDTICCPVCNANYLSQDSCVSSILGFVRKIIPPYFSFALDVLDFIGTAAEVILPSTHSAYVLNGGTCGNPLCHNGQIPEPSRAIAEANKIAAQQYQDQQSDIQELESKLGMGGTHIIQTPKDMYFGAGIGAVNSANPYAYIGKNSNSYHSAPADKTPTVLINKADGFDAVAHNDVPMIPGGNLVYKAVNKIQFIAGTPGMEFNTGGKIKINAGDLEITACHSDLILASKYTTVVKGKGVHIDVDDSDGTGGFLINAKRSRVAGSLSVDADMAVKGGLTLDGELSVPFLAMPSMRTKTTVSSGPDSVTNAAQWSAAASSAYGNNLATNQVTHYAEVGYLATISGATHLALATYNQSVLSTILEIIPTGICITDAGIGTVFNYVHTHGLSPQDHTHESTIPKGSYTNDLGSWAQERCQNNIIPTPARHIGDSSTPGPRSHGSCGLCGSDGGGIINTFSTTTSNTTGTTDNTGKPILTPSVGSNC
jgi:hypothetical protein